jgi:cytochrome c oxidase subunit 2
MVDPYAQDDIVVKELHIPKRKYTLRCVLKMFFTRHMPYFRAQMNCVPGMVTEFVEPIYTTAEYRELPYMVKKVANINAIRAKKVFGAR